MILITQILILFVTITTTTQCSSIAPKLTVSKIICTHPADKGVSLTQQYEIIAKNISLQIT